MKKKLPLSIFEIVAYSVLALLGIWGLVYIALGVSCEFISYKSALYAANQSWNPGFMVQGFIIAGVALVAAVIVLLINAKNSDRDYEKAQRRAARLAKDNPVVDVEAKPVEE